MKLIVSLKFGQIKNVKEVIKKNISVKEELRNLLGNKIYDFINSVRVKLSNIILTAIKKR
ncbi:hypothetical protein [Clostridium novyi]|uniref:hypothetical protein n=1 Tax=Clostridium novyi TaxID=1542 RepID=UPI000A863336